MEWWRTAAGGGGIKVFRAQRTAVFQCNELISFVFEYYRLSHLRRHGPCNLSRWPGKAAFKHMKEETWRCESRLTCGWTTS